MYPYLSVDNTYDHRVVRTTIDTFTTSPNVREAPVYEVSLLESDRVGIMVETAENTAYHYIIPCSPFSSQHLADRSFIQLTNFFRYAVPRGIRKLEVSLRHHSIRAILTTDEIVDGYVTDLQGKFPLPVTGEGIYTIKYLAGEELLAHIDTNPMELRYYRNGFLGTVHQAEPGIYSVFYTYCELADRLPAKGKYTLTYSVGEFLTACRGKVGDLYRERDVPYLRFATNDLRVTVPIRVFADQVDEGDR